MCGRFWYDHIHLSRKNFANVQSANCPGLIQPAAEMPVSSVGPWCESRSTPNLGGGLEPKQNSDDVGKRGGGGWTRWVGSSLPGIDTSDGRRAIKGRFAEWAW